MPIQLKQLKSLTMAWKRRQWRDGDSGCEIVKAWETFEVWRNIKERSRGGGGGIRGGSVEEEEEWTAAVNFTLKLSDKDQKPHGECVKEVGGGEGAGRQAGSGGRTGGWALLRGAGDRLDDRDTERRDAKRQPLSRVNDEEAAAPLFPPAGWFQSGSLCSRCRSTLDCFAVLSPGWAPPLHSSQLSKCR